MKTEEARKWRKRRAKVAMMAALPKDLLFLS
jgi:hypothetical protein